MIHQTPESSFASFFSSFELEKYCKNLKRNLQVNIFFQKDFFLRFFIILADFLNS